MEDKGGCGILVVVVVLIIWFFNHQSNNREEALAEQYEAGYEDGQAEISREDIAREEVERDPTTYCSDHLDNFIANFESKFNCYPK